MIELAQLGSGQSNPAAAATITLATIPVGYHARLRRSIVMCDTAGVTYTLFVETAAGPGVLLVPPRVGGANVSMEDAGDVALLEADRVRCFMSGAGQIRWIISGTIYSN